MNSSSGISPKKDKHLPPFLLTLPFGSTRNERGDCTSILATVRLYCIFQFAVFDFLPFTHTLISPVDAGIQGILPSVTTLKLRSTWNQRSN
jgi:hypothetical protein